jgi:tight adherence protein B
MIKEQVIMIIVASGAAMFLLGTLFIVFTVLNRPKVLKRKRIKELGVIGEVASADKGEGRRAKRIQDKIKQLEQKTKKRSNAEAIRLKILQAGVDITVGTFFILSSVLGLVSALVYLVMGYPPIGGVAVALIAGLLVPRLILGNMTSKRQKKFTDSFADAIDLVVRGIRSGLPVNECFNVVAREFEAPLGEEFRLLVEGQNLGMTIEDLLDKGIERIPTSEYKFFAIVIQIQRQTGGNLADTLANLSGVLRDRKKMRDKARAMASEATASAGIIGSLPFAVGLLLSVVNPDYLMILFTEETGQYLIAFGLFWMFLGAMVMRKMINFKM